MANGSFGLSGLPTAPTTVGSAPNNPFTPVSVAVNSTTGFEAGSFIYNRAGDLSTPVSVTGTATFPITSTEPAMNSASGSWLTTPTTASGTASVINNAGIVGGYTYAATLTNGNIVLGYRASDGTVRFRIIDESYATVVSEVTTTFVAWSFNLVGVTALTGGGFVIFSQESSNNFEFAIYNNSGTLVTARTADTTYVFNSNFLNVVARPDGSWIVYGTTSTTLCVYKVYSATGVQVYAWTTIGTSNTNGGQWSISVRSDNSFVLVFPITGTNMITYAVRSATNTVTVAPTSTTVTLNTNQPLTSICLSNNDVVFIYQATNSTAITARKLTSANVLGAEVSVYSPTATYFQTTNHLDAFLLPSDNYVIGFGNQLSSVKYSYTNNYIVVNSSGAIVSGTNAIRLPNTHVNSGSHNYNVFVKTTNYIHHVNYLIIYATVTGTLTQQPTVTIGTRINQTTFQPINNQSVTLQVGNTAVQSISGYAPSGSSVDAASYYAATSGTVTTSVASTTGAITGTQIEAFTVNAMDACSLTGGGCAILYYQTSSGTLKVAIYNVSMVLQTTLTVNTGFTGGVGSTFKVTQLTNGKLVVGYQTGTNTLSYNVYSTSYALLTTFAAPGSSYSLGTTLPINLVPLSGARFAVVYHLSNQPTYIVYSDTGTVLVSNTTIHAFTWTGTNATRTPSGFAVYGFYSGAGANYFYNIWETTDQSNSFSSSGPLSSTSSANALSPGKAATTVSGACLFPFATGTQTKPYFTLATRGVPVNNISAYVTGSYISTTGDFTTNSFAVVGAPCIGGGVYGVLDTVARTFQYTYQAGGIFSTSESPISLTFTNNDVATATPSLIIGTILVGLYGSIMVLVYANASRNPAYALINVNDASYSTTLVAGTTPSNATQTLSTATGYSLIGVSSTAAPANGQGTVVINGPAQLNSNYSASTTGRSFNFQNPVTFGVAGTISGRNVNLIGNV